MEKIATANVATEVAKKLIEDKEKVIFETVVGKDDFDVLATMFRALETIVYHGLL